MKRDDENGDHPHNRHRHTDEMQYRYFTFVGTMSERAGVPLFGAAASPSCLHHSVIMNAVMTIGPNKPKHKSKKIAHTQVRFNMIIH